MKLSSKFKDITTSDTFSWILFYILLALIIIETLVHPEPHSRAIRGLAIAMLLLAILVRQKRK